jgi:hypothetical protein
MSEESRSKLIAFRITPSLWEAIQADRRIKGQPLVEWFERASRAILPEDVGKSLETTAE